MKKEVIVLVLLGILLVSPLVLAQEQYQTYSGFNRFIDNVKIFFASGDNKVRLALEVREKEVDSAIINSQNQEESKAIKNLERAKEKLQIVQEKVSLDTSEEIKINVDEIISKLNEEENLPDEFEDYLLEEKITQSTAELTEKTYEYCKELSKGGYEEMLREEICHPDTSVEGLKEELKELKQIQEKSFNELMLDIRSCIDDPGTCSCEDVLDMGERAQCEKMIALAVRCEYKDDQEACNQIKSMRPRAKSFIPDFLMNLFKEKEGMIDYDIEKSDVPPECYNENTKPECEQYRFLKETSTKCWDDKGNWNEEECGGPKEKEPTMQESIPQCYDENNNFLEEKCGKITMVKNEEGLINYLIEKEIENIIEEFENKSEEHTIDVDNKKRQTMINEMKKEIYGIKGQMSERTFAPGTSGVGEPGKDIGDVVVERGDGFGDDESTPEVKTEVTEGGNGNNVVDTPSKTKDNEDVTPKPNIVDDTIDEGPGEPGQVDED